MDKRYESEQLMAIHESAQSLFRAGVITEAQMREYDEACLVLEGAPKTLHVRKAPTPAYTSPPKA
jgi:DNA-binding transcriptional regulator YiaG